MNYVLVYILLVVYSLYRNAIQVVFVIGIVDKKVSFIYVYTCKL